jgi:hypothetical protein
MGSSISSTGCVCLFLSFVRLSKAYCLRWSNYAWTYSCKYHCKIRIRSHRFASIYVRSRLSISLFAIWHHHPEIPSDDRNSHERIKDQPTNQPTETMHFLTTALNLLCLTTSFQVLASPLTFTDIERRWSAGESDVSDPHDSSYHVQESRTIS